MRRATIQQRTRILFAGEGASERSYGAWLQKITDIHDMSLHFDTRDCGGGTPLQLVLETRKIIRQEKVKSRDDYKFQALLLDRDTLGENEQNDDLAIQIASENDIHLIWQRPVHEGFLLRHFLGKTTLLPVKSRCQSELRKVLADYEKPYPASSLIKVLDLDSLLLAATVEPDLKLFLEKLGLL